MKKSIIIAATVLTAISLTAVGLTNSEPHIASAEEAPCQAQSEVDALLPFDQPTVMLDATPKYFIALGPRFQPVKRSTVERANSVSDFLSMYESQDIVSYESVEVIYLIDDQQSNVRAAGKSDQFNTQQRELLKGAPHSTNFVIRAEVTKKNPATAQIETISMTPHCTVVPEQQAEYSEGAEALLQFFETECQAQTEGVAINTLSPAKLYFTVTREGEIDKVKLDRTSGNADLDTKVQELIKQLPGNWTPAHDAKGKAVDQELVLSFGLEGC